MSETTARAGEPGAVRQPGKGREAEWGRRFAALTMAWLAAEKLTGLAVWLLPFSVPAQWTVVVHTAVGLVFLLPALVYQWQHVRVYLSRPGSAVKWMGWLATSAAYRAARSGSSRPSRRRTSARLLPSAYCMAMKKQPSCSPQS